MIAHIVWLGNILLLVIYLIELIIKEIKEELESKGK